MKGIFGWTCAGLCLAVAVLLPACGGRSSRKPVSQTLDTPGKIRLAESYFRGGRGAEAMEIVEEAVRSDPENAGLRSYHGQLCLRMGRLEAAEQALLDALEIDPYLTDAHNTLGKVYDLSGRKEDAEREFRKALEDPSYPTPEKVYFNLGLLYRSQERLEDAIAMLRKAVEVDTKYYPAHYELAATLESIGKLEEAAREYVVAAPGYRNQGTYLYRLGFTYFRLGDRTRARENLSRVLEVSPGSESAAKAEELLKMME
jgi:Tfp pilus assembly protein PilF